MKEKQHKIKAILIRWEFKWLHLGRPVYKEKKKENPPNHNLNHKVNSQDKYTFLWLLGEVWL